MLKNCIIGYSGFVGNNIIKNNLIFDEFYNSSNINDINDNYNIIVFTGLSGNVGYVNNNYQEDYDNIFFFIDKLKNIKCNKFILISTINVYENLDSKMNENDILQITNKQDYYGKHRLIFEKFIMNNYIDYHILRLPSIYGSGLKKGVLFDLINENYLENICINDELQFYDLEDINKEIKYVCDNNIKILNLVSEPIKISDLIINIFTDYKIINDLTLEYKNKRINLKNRIPKKLNIYSKYFQNNYIYNNSLSMEKIKLFINNLNKLLVLIPLYKIDNHLNETNNNNTLYNTYTEMYNISSNSYLKYNNNIEIRKIESKTTLNNYGEMFKNIIEKIIKIHFFEKRDILYVESDTICFNNINFDNINKLLMFNLGISSCDIISTEYMMNSGIIYIPKNCNLNYEYTINLFKSLDYNIWINFEKFWNILYYNQFTNFEESIIYNKYIGIYNFLKSSYIPTSYIYNLRKIDFFSNNKPSIVHIGSSRGSNKCLEIMNIIKNYNIHTDYNNIYNTLPIL
jgi:hypothetical protein